MSTLQVNGDVAHTSAFVDHLISYPVIGDSVDTIKSHPLGQKSIELSSSIYQSVAAPVVPYFAKPIEIIKPYAKALDDQLDRGLGVVDEKFPIVKTPTRELFDGARAFAFLPFRIGNAGKERVFNTYSAEYKKCGNNNNLTTIGKATVTTTLILTTETLTTLNNFLSSKKEDVKQAAGERANN